jgi:hypothetical protein
MRDIIREEARLILLRSLSAEVSGTLNSSLLQAGLESWGIAKSRDWVHAELRALEERGAVRITEQGSVLIAAITARGMDHVTRRTALDGVKRPSAE